MELVYLWVEDYKNIHRQGFNFSGRYRCNYDHEKNELTIDKNDDYVHIFPNNINVTAIVGGNGSGKSSVLVGLTNHKIVVEKSNKLLSNDFNNAYIEPLDRKEDYEIVYVDFDLIKISPVTDYWDYLAFNIFDKNLYKIVENGFSGDLNINIAEFGRNFYNLIIEHVDSFKSGLFFFNPVEISFSDYLHPINEEAGKFNYINKLITGVQDNHCSKEKFLVFLYSHINMRIPPDIKQVEEVNEILLLENEILENENTKHFKLENIEEIYSFFDALVEYKQKPKIEIEIENFSSIYNKHKKAFLKLIEIGYLQIELNDFENREYFGLSQGERKLFTEFLMIFDAIKKTDKDDMLIVLDEPDLTLHPQWQKNYIKELIILLSNFLTKKFHVIITSHSPFILSDIPKENVIFLEKGEQVYPFENMQTFGANIHTLLSHGFFMSDGLMGEFAKGKINEIIEFHNKIKADNIDKKVLILEYEKHKTQFWHIQNIIGEEYLKQVIKNHLIEIEKILLGKDEAKHAEIRRVEAYLTSLKND